MSKLEQTLRKHLKYNIAVNVLDGAFFGLGWGFGSFGTIIPLFVSRLTQSATLIGLIPAIHGVGWQLPQLFMANAVARQRRYKPMVLWLTIHERLPYLGLALIAWFMPSLTPQLALTFTFLLLIWQGLGSGFTANAWQSMIAKIIPPDWRGTFIGLQSAAANILISLAAVGAGYLLNRLDSPLDFSLCFTLTFIAMGISMLFLGLTREPEDNEKHIPEQQASFWQNSLKLLRHDQNFLSFLILRLVWQFAMMGFAFYIVYGLRTFGMNEITAGWLTAALTGTQIAANLIMGWLGDRLGHRAMLVVGALSTALSSFLAWQAQSIAWLYLVFILNGLANVSYWTIGIAFTVAFGTEEERPIYIGLSNTLVAPFAILAPLIGGWIADSVGYRITFLVSAIIGLMVTILIMLFVHNPRPPANAPIADLSMQNST
ncbi:MAG: MFS transporter [Candidatus Villigracilaceae bacterium]